MTDRARPTGRIVITGVTGFLGLNLARRLAEFECEAVLISRHPPAKDGRWNHAVWDGRSVGQWADHLEGAAAW